MATIELFEPLPVSRADHWHRVGAPGGYEWWEFDAIDDAAGLRVIFRFFDGYIFDPEYARRYDAYRRRPTAHVPPVARQFPCAQFAVFEHDLIVAGNTIRFGEGAFLGDAKSGAITVGDNHLELRDGETRLRFHGGDPGVSAEMVFKSRNSLLPIEEAIFAGDARGQHRWVLPQMRCDVEGAIGFHGRQIRLAALGYHDHFYGTGPMGPSVRRWLRGRAMLPGRTVAFHVWTDHASGRDEYVAVGADDARMGQIDGGECSCDWSKRTWRGLTYPSAVNFGQSLVLRRPRILDSSGNSVQVLFDGYIDGESCTAWGQIDYPARLHRRLSHPGLAYW